MVSVSGASCEFADSLQKQHVVCSAQWIFTEAEWANFFHMINYV